MGISELKVRIICAPQQKSAGKPTSVAFFPFSERLNYGHRTGPEAIREIEREIDIYIYIYRVLRWNRRRDAQLGTVSAKKKGIFGKKKRVF